MRSAVLFLVAILLSTSNAGAPTYTIYLPVILREPNVTTEQWSEGVSARWNNIGNVCWTAQDSVLRMRCQSAGIVTRQTFSAASVLTITGTFRARSVVGGKYWAGATIYMDDYTDTLYGEAVLANMVPPFILPYPVTGALFDDRSAYVLEKYVSGWQWHTYQVTRQPSGKYDVVVNERAVSYNGIVDSRRWSVFLLCVSVGEATPDDGSMAECEFGPIRMEIR